MDSVTAVPGRGYTLPEPGFTAPEGCAFEAWTVVIGGNNMGDILPGDTITVPTATSDIAGTATAKWSDKCVIKFKAGDEGASGSMDDELVEIGGKYTLPKCGFTAPDGKIFKEWSVANVDGSGSAESKNPGEWWGNPAAAHPYPFHHDTLFEPVEVTFGDLTVMAPHDWDRFLTDLYQDYMTLPDPDKRHTHTPYMLDVGDGVALDLRKDA